VGLVSALFQPPAVPEWSTLSPSQTTSATSTSQTDEKRLARERLAWQTGNLRWILNSDQREVYDIIRAWEKLDPTEQGGLYPRIWDDDIGRRWGKTTLRFVMRCEDAIRNPGHIYRISSAYQKNVDEIVNDVARRVLQTCPEDLRPKYLESKQRFTFWTGSEIRLVGLDLHPDGLRGRACDGDDIDEAGFVKGLKYAIKSVLYPQYQGRPHARLFLSSSAPKVAESEYDEIVEDCKARGAYVFRTIEDNPMLTPEEREEFLSAMGGRDHYDCRREYFNERVRDPEGSVVPEFSIARHVLASTVPAYAHCYVGADPGTRDKFGLVFAYWDAERAKLVVQRSWAERNASLADVAEVIRSTEQELWGVGADKVLSHPPVREGLPANSPEPLQYWDGERLQPNPYRRISDTDARTIFELHKAHGITFAAADKSHAQQANDAGSARRLPTDKLYAIRQAFLSDQIEIWPDSGPLQHQLNAGRWNDQRTDFERSDTHGHLDCLMALVYLWRGVSRNLNPEKPAWAGADPAYTFVPKHLTQQAHQEVADLNQAFAGGGISRFRAPARVGGFR
jgi:hypothetical protein